MRIREFGERTRWCWYRFWREWWHAGTAAAVVSAAAAGTYVLVLLPEEAALAQLKAEVSKPLPRPGAESQRDEATPSGARIPVFPHLSSLPSLMREVYAAASAQGLNADAGTYSLAHEAGLAVSRYDVALPLKGSYPQIRRFLTAVLRDHPSMALVFVSLSRQRADDPAIQAELRFSIYLSTGTQ